MDELLKTQVRHIFDSANFVRDMGMQLTRIEDEYCETILVPAERHLQQHGLIHAGVMATMADHTSGCAARGVVGFDHDVVSVEFKINFLRPIQDGKLVARSHLLRIGRRLCVGRVDMFDSKRKLAAVALVTYMLLE